MKKIISAIILLCLTAAILGGCSFDVTGLTGTNESLNGENGKTPYELAVEAGFNGTEEEWVASLQGESPDETPYVGENGNWWVGSRDTGVSATGKDYVENNLTSPALKDCNVLILGDSLMGKESEDTGIAAIIADITGANVYNGAISGSTAGANKNAEMAAFSLTAIAEALTAKNFSAQDAALSALASKDEYPNLEKNLQTLKGVNLEEIDCVILSYGLTDFDNATPIQSGSENFKDSVRRGIETLYEAANLKIYLSTPTFRYYTDSFGEFIGSSDKRKNAANHTLENYVNAIVELAEEYNVPSIDNYHFLGINDLNINYYYEYPSYDVPNRIGRTLLARHIAARITRT